MWDGVELMILWHEYSNEVSVKHMGAVNSTYRKEAKTTKEYNVVYLLLLLSSKLYDSVRECQTSHCIFLVTFKTTFNTITNTAKAFSLTQAVMNKLKYEMNQNSFLQLL